VRRDVECDVTDGVKADILLGETLDYCGMAESHGLRFHSHVHNICDNGAEERSRKSWVLII
jgi:hypothetical protein